MVLCVVMTARLQYQGKYAFYLVVTLQYLDIMEDADLG